MDRDKIRERIDKLVEEHKANRIIPYECRGNFHDSIWTIVMNDEQISFCIGCGKIVEEG
jgi:hypothetical protein